MRRSRDRVARAVVAMVLAGASLAAWSSAVAWSASAATPPRAVATRVLDLPPAERGEVWVVETAGLRCVVVDPGPSVASLSAAYAIDCVEAR